MPDRTIIHEFAFWPSDKVRLTTYDAKRHDDIIGLVVVVELAVRSASGDRVERVNVQWINSDGSLGKEEWIEAWMLRRTDA